MGTNRVGATRRCCATHGYVVYRWKWCYSRSGQGKSPARTSRVASPTFHYGECPIDLSEKEFPSVNAGEGLA
ncbi:hypothetical protein GCM10009836_46310 [Pseudonocardia ailaonensis]|uniref:Transposase n=1 Tax=Pseudonocardia ailaonensis TaxID=367279 RepID=A0ABN2NE06_9PSEU